MFIHFLLFFLNMKTTFSTIIIQGAGIYDVKADDIAIIFYLTVENSYDHSIHAKVSSIKCSETNPFGEEAEEMLLIGGDAGALYSKSVTNLTLIYPNLYLENRAGRCLLALNYEADDKVEQKIREVRFQTMMYLKNDYKDHTHEAQCGTMDQDPKTSCAPVDCVIKYSSQRSYFNKEFNLCQPAPQCPPNNAYNPKSNTCRKDHEAICKNDLEMIEDGYVEKCWAITNYVNFICHNGVMNNNTGNCDCDDGWITSTCDEGLYHPTLNVYHMCNLEISSWGKSNRQKLIITILALIILALALAAKMLLAVCLLNWCCRFLRRRSSEEFCEFDSCPYLNVNCGDELCDAGATDDGDDDEKTNEKKSSKSCRVSFSDVGASSGGESDGDRLGSSASNVSKCHCGGK